MDRFVFPEPVLDAREHDLMKTVTEQYRKFTKPGLVSKGARALQDVLAKIAPEKLVKLTRDAVDAATEADFIKLVLKHAGRGFVALSKHASRFTLSHDDVLTVLGDSGCGLDRYQQICGLRSYDIERCLAVRNLRDLVAAFVQGAGTGWPGLPGVPFDIALSTFLYFRAVQSTALYYGYDVKGDPGELEFAAEVTMTVLAPTLEQGAETIGGMIGKIMVATNVTALTRTLRTSTFKQMAERGGSELVYVQIRALANKAAEKALNAAERQGLEVGIFKKLLEQIGRRLPKEAGKKAIPLVGALVGALSNTYYMDRVLRGANLIYHKRFLFEKEHRIDRLRSDNGS